MNALKKRHSFMYEICEYFFVFFCIINFRVMWQHSPDYSLISQRIIIIAIIFFGLLCIIAKGRIRGKNLRKGIMLATLTLIIISFQTVIAYYSIEDSLRFAALTFILLLYHFVCGDGNLGFYKKLSDIMLGIAIISLFFWVFGTVLGVIRPSGTIYTTWTSWSISGQGRLKAVRNYYNIYFEAQSWGTDKALGIITNLNIIRNTGVFTETPMYSFLLVLSLCIEIFLKKKKDKNRIVVFLITIITTISTTGYVLSIIALFADYLLNSERGNIRKTIKIMIIPIVLIATILAVSQIVESKLSTTSATTRIDDFVAGFEAFKDSPIFGNGMGNTYSYQQYMSSFRANNAGLSNSITQILAFGGLVLIIPYAYCTYRGIRICLKQKDLMRLTFFSLFLLMFIFTIAPFQAIPLYVFIEMGFHDNYKSKLIAGAKNGKPRISATQ